MSPWTALLLPLLATSGPAAPAADTTAAADSLRLTGAPPEPAPVLRPIRTNTPGTGVFIGSGLVVRTLYDRESADDETLTT